MACTSVRTDSSRSISEASLAPRNAVERVRAAARAVLDEIDFPQPYYRKQLERVLTGNVSTCDLGDIESMVRGAAEQFTRCSGKLSFTLKRPPAEVAAPSAMYFESLRVPEGRGPSASPAYKERVTELFQELASAARGRYAETRASTLRAQWDRFMRG